MAALTPVTPAITGSTFAPAAASAGGDSFPNPRGNGLLYVKNASGGSINVTIAAQAPYTTRPADGPYPSQTVGNIVVAVGAGVERIIGPIPGAYNDGNGSVQITYSGVTSLTVAAIQFP